MSNSCSLFAILLLPALLSLAKASSGGEYQYDAVRHVFKKVGDDTMALNTSSWDEKPVNCSKPFGSELIGRMEDDYVQSLPGTADLGSGGSFDQYAGYVTVDPQAGRALFYYFVGATTHLEDTPLLLWINGGGNWESHSSLGRGAMMGHGPFKVNADGITLSPNDYSWNAVANVIFLESPVGVGFSYSNTTSDYDHAGDTSAVEDSFTFLINWLEKFPQYKTRDLYIAGDGYAGHGIPQLAQKILQYNNGCNQISIKLQGIAIGNGWMDEEIFLKGVYDYYGTENLITSEIHDGITTTCNFSFPISLSSSCLDFLNRCAGMVGGVNPYDVHGPLCDPSSVTNISAGGFDSCSHLYVESYFNQPIVQEALHANTTTLPYPWTIESSVVKQWKSWYPTVSPLLQNLMKSGTRVWLYSGDTDSVVPTTSTKYFIESLQLPIQNSSYPWYAAGEVAGYATGYENLTFVVVRGGGHFASSYQPARALTLISSFIEGKLPPNSPK